MFGFDPVEDEITFVDRLPRRGVDQDWQLFQWVVLWCLRGFVPWDFGLEREGDFLFEQCDAYFAGVGAGCCTDEGVGWHFGRGIGGEIEDW